MTASLSALGVGGGAPRDMKLSARAPMISSSISSSLPPMRRPPAVSRTAAWSTVDELADEPIGDIGNGNAEVRRSPMITGVGCRDTVGCRSRDTGDFSGDDGWNDWIVWPFTTLSSSWRVAGLFSCISPCMERPREMRRARSTERRIRVGLPGRLVLRLRASGEWRPAEPNELLEPKEPCEWRCERRWRVGLLLPAGTGEPSVAEAVPLEHSTELERSAELKRLIRLGSGISSVGF